MSKLRAAVIGLGGMGRRHISALEAAGLLVAGVCDFRLETAREVAAASPLGLAGCQATGDWRELVRPGAFDLVAVATNGPSHHEIVLRAAASNIPFVLCEKPLSTSGAKAREMAEACRASGTRLAVNLCRRFFTRCLLLRQQLQAGLIGRPRRMLCHIGGGGIGCVGMHYFDMAAWLFDATPLWISAEVCATPAPNVRGPQFFDPGGQASIGFACTDGHTFVGDFEMSEDVPRASHCLIIGTEGVLEFDDHIPQPCGFGRAQVRPLAQRATVKTRLVPPEDAAFDNGPALDIVQATRDAVLDLVGPHAVETVQAAIQAVDLVLAAHLSSARSGARVALPLAGADLDLDIAIT